MNSRSSPAAGLLTLLATAAVLMVLLVPMPLQAGYSLALEGATATATLTSGPIEPGPTATLTATATATSASASTPPAAATSTATPAPTPSASATPAATETPTATPLATTTMPAAGTIAPTAATSPTPTATRTATASPPATASPSATATTPPGLVGVAQVPVPVVDLAPLVTAGNPKGWPDVYQGAVVYAEWIDGSYYRVHAKQVSTGTPWALSPESTAHQLRPRIYADSAVWADYRNGAPPQLYRYDNLAIPGSATVSVAASSGSASAPPAIFGNFIAYQDRSTGSRPYLVRIKDLASGLETTLAGASGDQDHPSLADGLIAFQQSTDLSDGGRHVRLFSFSLANGSYTLNEILNNGAPLVPATSNQSRPQLSGSQGNWTLVWEDDRAGNPGIFGFRPGVGEFQLSAGAAKVNPAISGDLVVWEDRTSGSGDIHGRRVGDPSEFTISSAPADETTPRVHGDRAVWVSGSTDVYTATIQWSQATETPTPTSTAMPTATATATPSATPTATGTSGATATATPSATPTHGPVGIRLSQTSVNATVGDEFSLDILIDSGSQPFNGAQAYLSFPAAGLEVVPHQSSPLKWLQPGAALPLEVEQANVADNQTGRVSYAAAIANTTVSGNGLVLATVRFRAKAAGDHAIAFQFDEAAARVTKVVTPPNGDDLLQGAAHATNSTVHVAAATATPTPTSTPTATPTPTAITLNGRVALERRGSAGDARWITELFRTAGGATTGGVKVYQAGTANLLGSFQGTTDANGGFSAVLNGIGPGTYDVVVKGSNTLSNKRSGVSLPSGTEIDFGTLLVGDASGDDAVNGLDVSYMVPSFWKSTGETGFRPYADTNADGAINGLDVSALVPNFWKAGPVELP